MKIRICDFCGTELDRNEHRFFTVRKNFIFGKWENGQTVPDPCFVKLDICEACMAKIIRAGNELYEDDTEDVEASARG